MKKAKSFILISLMTLVLLFATSCFSTIGLRTLVPAEVNVSGYKTIAVQSTSYNYSPADMIWRSLFIPIKGNIDPIYYDNLKVFTLFDNTTPSSVAKYSTDNLVDAIDKGFYTIVSPELTDALILVGKNSGSVRQTFMSNNVDALLNSSISYMYYDEYITSEPIYDKVDSSKVTGYNFYIVQNATISFTYTVVDVEDNVLIANKTQTLSSGDITTLIGHTDPKDKTKFIKDADYFEYISATSLFKALEDQFFSAVTNQLTPHYEYRYFDLMSNKPKKQSVKQAYEYVDNGNYRVALDMFLKEYNASGHIPSGYNAAILYYALGEYNNAFDLSLDVYNKSGNSDALSLYYTLKSILEKQEAAISQINSTTKAGSSGSSELIGF